MEIRTVILYTILSLSILDLVLTYIYVRRYKKWQPNKPYKLIELNPILRFSWDNFGLNFGTIIGSFIILSLNVIVARHTHWIILVILFIFLSWAIFNHQKNIRLLSKLIEKYPSGHLPEEIFSKVEGNNAG